jgi:hypothetical protein
MLSSTAISVRRTLNTTVVFDPAARFARTGAILVTVAFDADHPIGSAQLSPTSAARGALLECSRVGDARVGKARVGMARVGNARGTSGIRLDAAIGRYIEGKLGVAAEC